MNQNAIVCNTPLQILNAINIVANNVENTKNYTDLYVVETFKNAESIISKLKESHLFQHIFTCKMNASKKTGSKIKTFAKLLNGKKLWEDYVFEGEDVLEKVYDTIFVGDNNTLGIALKSVSPKAKTIIYDDGLDSYIGNCITERIGKAYQIIGKLFKTGVFSYDIQKLLVNNKDFCASTVSENIEQLPKLTKANPAYELALKIFSFLKEGPVKDYTFILLGQPLEEMNSYNGVPITSVLEGMKENGINVLLREHPRQKPIECSDVVKDEVNNLWELECMESVTDNHILAGFYSTAQMAPKFIADKEPYVIFLYKLFLNDLTSTVVINYEKVIRLLKENYRNSGKIFVPETIEEYYAIIQKLYE